MSDTDAVRVDIEDTIATVTINRPESRNALNQAGFHGLQTAAQAVTPSGGPDGPAAAEPLRNL